MGRARPQISRVSLYIESWGSPNFNWCFELSGGEYFKWCAADDIIHPEYLERCVAALDAHPDAALAYSGAHDIDNDGRIIGEIHDNRWPLRFDSPIVTNRFIDLIATNHACISVFGLMRASALKKSSLIGSYAASDHVLLAEIALQGRFIRIGDDLLLHREHSGRFTRTLKTQQERGAWFDTARGGPSFPNWRLLREYSACSPAVPAFSAGKSRLLRGDSAMAEMGCGPPADRRPGLLRSTTIYGARSVTPR